MNDKSIVARCLTGESQAFEIIVNKYQSPLLHFTWSILGDQDEAKDVTQDTLVRTYIHLDSYDPERNFKTWMYTIAHNICMDKIREKRSRMRFIKNIQKVRHLTVNRENPQKIFETSQQYGQLLKKLNERERTAIVLKWNEGYRSREIAEILGCKESTVRVYILNAKRKLKKILEKK